VVSDPPAAQRGDVPGVLADPLEAGDQDDPPLVERGLQAGGRDVDDFSRCRGYRS